MPFDTTTLDGPFTALAAFDAAWPSGDGERVTAVGLLRNTSSGTYSDFKDMAMSKRDYAASSQKLAGNEQIAAEVAKNPNGIGYVGIA
jgi:phosphate transport system substrate-binding protein